MAWVEVGLPAGLRAASGGEVVRDRVRTVARPLIRRAPTRLRAVREAWQAIG